MDTEFFESFEDLIGAASDISEDAVEEYKQSVYLYFISRYLVSIFETKIEQLPIQVWNDYKNALDHFMRFVSTRKGEPIQIKRMEGHIQRAALDICKFICIKSGDLVDRKIEQETPEVLRLVDNGIMYDNILTLKATIESKLLIAKFHDKSLGDDAMFDKEILTLYMEPAFDALKILDIFSGKRKDITRVSLEISAQKKDAIQESSEKWYAVSELKKSIFQNIVWFILGATVIYFSGFF